MAKTTKGIPRGTHTLTPHLIVRDAAKAIDWYKKALGAEEVLRLPMPDGRGIMHAEMKIGDSRFYMGEESPQWEALSPQSLKGSPVSLHIYVQNADAAFKRAVDAGATAKMPVADQFWGDRYGKIQDPFGHQWSIATQIKVMTPEQIAKGAKEFFAKMSKA
jgi:uncharacterized glyoxalase superfamily protein PhnB